MRRLVPWATGEGPDPLELLPKQDASFASHDNSLALDGGPGSSPGTDGCSAMSKRLLLLNGLLLFLQSVQGVQLPGPARSRESG